MPAEKFIVGNLDKSENWHNQNGVSAKVGTVPMLIIFDRRKKLAIGERIQFRKAERRSNWENGIVRGTEPVLFIDRM